MISIQRGISYCVLFFAFYLQQNLPRQRSKSENSLSSTERRGKIDIFCIAFVWWLQLTLDYKKFRFSISLQFTAIFTALTLLFHWIVCRRTKARGKYYVKMCRRKIATFIFCRLLLLLLLMAARNIFTFTGLWMCGIERCRYLPKILVSVLLTINDRACYFLVFSLRFGRSRNLVRISLSAAAVQ